MSMRATILSLSFFVVFIMRNNKIRRLTVSELKSYSELDSLSTQEVEEIIEALFELSLITYQVLEKQSQEAFVKIFK